MKKFILMLVVALLYTWMSHTNSHAGEDVYVRILPAQGTYQIGGEFRVEVWVENVTDLYVMDIRLGYDPTMLQVIETHVQPDWTFFSPDAILFNTVNNTNGTIMYVASLLNPTPPVSGSGMVFSFHFRALTSGQANVEFTNHQLSKTGAVGIPNTAFDAVYTVMGQIFLPLLKK